MKLSKISLALLGMMALTACNDENHYYYYPDPVEGTDPVEEVRTISVGVSLKNVSEMNSLTSSCIPVTMPDQIDIPDLGHPVCAINDVDGNIHFIRTDSYQIEVTDSRGNVQVMPIDNISDFEYQQFDVVGDAVAKVTFVGELDANDITQYYTYYTVGTDKEGKELSREENEFQIQVENQQFSIVTFRSSGDDVDYMSTTLTPSIHEHNYNFGAITNMLNGPYAYRYIMSDATINFTMRNGATYNGEVKFQANKHYDFGMVGIDPNNGEIIILPPDFGDPITIIPTPEDAVIVPNQVSNAEVVTYKEGVPTYKAEPNRQGKAEPWIYPTEKFDGTTMLYQYDFSYRLSGYDGKPFMNIYLTPSVSAGPSPEDMVEIVYHSDDNIVVDKVEKITKEELYVKYGTHYLVNRLDGSKVNTNFIIRVYDDNEEEFEFSVEEYTMYKTDMGHDPISQSVTADNLNNIEIDSVGDLGEVYGTITREGNAYIFEKVSGESTLSEHVFDFNVEGFGDAYMNIYLKSSDGENTRFDYHTTGAYAGQFVCVNGDKYPCRSGGTETYDSYSELQAAYGDYTVRNYINGAMRGNFFLRNPDGVAMSQVVIHSFNFVN